MKTNAENKEQEVNIEERVESLEYIVWTLMDDFFSDCEEVCKNCESRKDEEACNDEPATEIHKEEQKTIEERFEKIVCDVCFLYNEYLASEGSDEYFDCEGDDERSIEDRLLEIEDIVFILCKPLLDKYNCVRRYLRADEEECYDMKRSCDGCDMYCVVVSDFYRKRITNIKLPF